LLARPRGLSAAVHTCIKRNVKWKKDFFSCPGAAR
jgi:hypothetical protein